MTQQDLATAADVPQSTVARIETGRVLPMTSTLMALLTATRHRLVVEPVGPAADRDGIRNRMQTPVAQRARQALGKRAKDAATSPMRLFSRLSALGVQCIVIGDLAEAIHGRPGRVAGPVEVCIPSTDTAGIRLAVALEKLGDLTGPNRLRVVTQTEAGDNYDALRLNAALMSVDTGLTARVAALQDLIRARRARGTVTDQQIAADLEAIAEES